MKNRSTQSDAGLEFNGQGKPVSYKGGNKGGGNYLGLTPKANYGVGPRVGNNGECSEPIKGPSVTKDPYRRAPATAKGR